MKEQQLRTEVTRTPSWVPAPDPELEDVLRRFRRRRSSRIIGTVTAGIVTAACVAVPLALLGTLGREPAPSSKPSVRVVRTNLLGPPEFGAGYVWLRENDGGLNRVQPASLTEFGPHLLCSASPPAFGGGSIWTYGDNDNGCVPGSTSRFTVWRIDPSSYSATGSQAVPMPIRASTNWQVVYGHGNAWALNWSEIGTGDNYRGEPGIVTRIDPTSLRVTGHFRIHKGAADLAVGLGSVWVRTAPSSERSFLTRVNPETLHSQGSIVMRGEGEVITGFGSVWTTDDVTGTLLRVDPATMRILARIPLGSRAFWLAVDSKLVWVAGEGGLVWRIDPRSNSVTDKPIRLHGTPTGIATGEDTTWVTAETLSRQLLYRIEEPS